MFLLVDFVQAQNVIPPSTKIAGLGWALFTTILLTILLTCLCIVFSQHEYAGYLYVGSGFVLALFVIVISRIPQIQVGSLEPLPPADIDWSYYPRIVFVSFTSIFGFLGVSGVGIYYYFNPVYASSLRFHSFD